jgi:hypothetical protein
MLKVAIFCSYVRILALNVCVLNSVGREGCTFTWTVVALLFFTSYSSEISPDVLFMSDIRAEKNILRNKPRPRGLRRRSAAARLLKLWIRIPPGPWIAVCCECCVLSGRDLCYELITCPEESYRLWCVVVFDLETS